MPRIDEIDRRTDAVFILFHYAGSVRGVTRVQKLLFLVEQETEFFQEYESEIAFNFAPYKMGPFSQGVYKELQFMLHMDALETVEMEDAPGPTLSGELSNKEFRITSKGRKIASQLAELLEPKYQQEVQTIVEEHNNQPLRELLRYVHTEYPGYTEESEIADEILQGAD